MSQGFRLTAKVYVKLCEDPYFSVAGYRPDIADEKQQKKSTHTPLAAPKTRRLWQTLDSEGTPPGLLSEKTSQDHLGSYLCALHRTTPCLMWHTTSCTLTDHACPGRELKVWM